MKDYLERPEVLVKAREDHGGHAWYCEIGIFLLVMLVGFILEAVVMIPIQLVMMFTNRELVDAMTSQNPAQLTETLNAFALSDPMQIASLFSFAALIISSFCLGKWVDKRKVASHGFRRKGMLREYGIGLLVGFVMFSAAVGICVLTGSVKLTLQIGSPVMLLLFLLGFMVQGMAEEVICRGLLMVSMSRRYSIPVAIMTNSLAFAALHLGNSGVSVLALINLVLFGVVASVYFIKRGDIWGVAAIHTIWNFVQGNFYGIRVSGMALENSVFHTTMMEEGSLINGGAFGLEGGLAVSVVLVVCLVIFWKMPGKDLAPSQDQAQ